MTDEDNSLDRFVEGLRRGDEKAWEEFRQFHGPELLRLVENHNSVLDDPFEAHVPPHLCQGSHPLI